MELSEEDFFGKEDLTKKVDTEVKKVADAFMFALKYKEQFQASGIEFSDLRQYQTSDDASRIDWKNSAKSQDLYVKEYEEEKDMDVFIILDVSDTMMFGTTEKLKSEFAAVAASALAYASIDNGINAGFGMFNEEEQVLMLPDGGQVQYQKILTEVTEFENYGGEFNLENALDSVIGQIKENTAVFLLTDFLNVKGEWEKKMLVASKKFRHVMNLMIRDLRDYRIPEAGNIRFSSMQGEQIVANTSKIADRYNEKALEQEQRIEDRVEASGASIIKVDTRDDFSGRFAKYLDESGDEW